MSEKVREVAGECERDTKREYARGVRERRVNASEKSSADERRA